MHHAPVSTPHQFLRMVLAMVPVVVMAAGLTVCLVFRVDPLWSIGAVAVLAALSFVPYVVVAYRIFTDRTPPTGGGRPAARPSETRALMERLADSMTHEMAEFYVQMVLDPARHTIRMTDRISPMSRAYDITRSMKVVIPAHLAGGRIPVPLDLISKANLVNRLTLQDQSATPVSTLSQDATIAHSALVVRRLVERVCPPAAVAEYVDAIEPDVIAFLCRNKLVSLSDPEFTRTIRRVVALSEEPWTRQRLLIVVSYLQVLTSHYPLVVYLTASDVAVSEELVAGECVRLAISRRTIPVMGKGLSRWDRARDWPRRMLGIRPAVITWSLAPAQRTRSYHLECMGPDGSYLARQRVYSDASEAEGEALLRNVNFKILPRHGQRFSHLYVHDLRPLSTVASSGGANSLHYVASFFERPPGSTATAAVSALTAAILVSAAANVRLWEHDGAGPGTDLIAILLAMPLVVSTWLGFGSSTSVFLGALGARVALLLTMGCSLVATGLYLQGPQDLVEGRSWWEQPMSAAWIAVAVVIWMTFLGAGASWAMRVAVYRYFIRRADVSALDSRED